MNTYKKPSRNCNILLAGILISCFNSSFAQTYGECIIDDVTEHIPPENCYYQTPQEVPKIIDGLPPGTTIEMIPTYEGVYCNATNSKEACLIENGGGLGGQRQVFDSVLIFEMIGTGQLASFHRIIKMDISSEWHSAPRIPTDAFQAFDTQVFSQQGVITGDPDFASLQIVAGQNFGLTSFGHSRIKRLSDGRLVVDSFFDLSNQISFVGAPGGVLDGLSGTTLNSTRLESRATKQPCHISSSASILVTECDIRSPNRPLEIIDGLPPGTTIELSPQITNIVCTGSGGSCGQNGGNLGGQRETFNATMVIQARGTGTLADFNRIIRLPLSAVTDSAPRSPNSPVQGLVTDLVHLQASITGDPDFATLDIFAGSANGLVSPGATVFVEMTNGNWLLDSFYETTFQIDFTGAPGGALEGLSGSTQMSTQLATREKQSAVIENDNGSGTVTLPPSSASYTTFEDHFVIENGLPPGSRIELIPTIDTFFCMVPNCGNLGGLLGGDVENYYANLNLKALGRGSLTGYQRTLNLPVIMQSHSAPKIAGSLEQMFDTDLFSMQATLFGDQDFDQLIITGGTNNSLPSPGYTNLKDLNDGTFQVDSFFDISYQIDYVGAPGSMLDGMSGTTTDTVTLTAVNNPATIAHSITIILNALSGQSTDIQFSGDLGNFTLDSDNNSTLSEIHTFSNLLVGDYHVSSQTPFIELVNIECTDPDAQSVINLPNFEAIIDLDFNEDVICTFTTSSTDIIFSNGFELLK